ncbi:MAG: cyclase family protein [Bacteroidetes bacterium]|nr:cyclase family protein [Bacteroidota bacterium]
MIATIHIDGRDWRCDLSAGLSIAIPLRFGGPQPNSYDVPAASSTAYEGNGFVGDTRRGGSCNFESLTLIPHCNGTHTECVGHIALDRIAVTEVLAPALLPATLVSVATPEAAGTGERYEPVPAESDRFITAAGLRDALDALGITAPGEGDLPDGPVHPFLEALCIRTLPNSEEKTARRYIKHPAPFFSIEAMRLVRALGVRHLLVDVPSLDRAFDEGMMCAHHIFWDVSEGGHDVDASQPSPRSVTEMIYVPDALPDGRWLLDIQIAPFVSDAAPSRPVLFPITEIRT